VTEGPWFLIRFYVTVIQYALLDRDDNRCHADALFSDRLRLRVHRSVRHSPLHFFFHVQCCLCHFRTHENRSLSILVFSKTKRTGTAKTTTLNGIKMSVNRAFEQRSSGSKNDPGLSTVFSTSEQIPQITGDPSKLDLTQASAHTLPVVSPSPVFEAESV